MNIQFLFVLEYHKPDKQAEKVKLENDLFFSSFLNTISKTKKKFE